MGGFGTGSANAARRVALVVGNSAYENVTALANPVNDAATIAHSLKAAGFDEVRLVDNLGQGQLLRALRDFATIAAGAETAVVYFAGHGVEVDGRNYLVPTDATLAKATDVDFEAVSLDAVRTAVSGATKLRVVILDACRNNPFKLASSDGKRSIGRGLARIEPGANELIAYAAREGTVASDGGGGANSPYATALAKYLEEPGLDVRLLFGRVRDDVKAATGDTQEPFIYGTLGGGALFLNASARRKSRPGRAGEERGADAGAGGVVERGRPAVADGREDDELRRPAELHRSHFQGGQCFHRLRASAQERAQLRFRADRQAPRPRRSRSFPPRRRPPISRSSKRRWRSRRSPPRPSHRR